MRLEEILRRACEAGRGRTDAQARQLRLHYWDTLNARRQLNRFATRNQRAVDLAPRLVKKTEE